MFRKPVLQWSCALLIAGAVAGCATTRTTSKGVVGVDRQQTMLISSAEVNRSAARAYQETINEARASRDAIEVVNEFKPDLVVKDFQMTIMDGLN